MDFADAFAQVKGKLGADSREAKSVAPGWIPDNPKNSVISFCMTHETKK
jgi:hypothetical protein